MIRQATRLFRNLDKIKDSKVKDLELYRETRNCILLIEEEFPGLKVLTDPAVKEFRKRNGL